MTFDIGTIKDLLRCPGSHSALSYTGGFLVCTDGNCRLQFEVRDEIPNLLLDEATQLSDEEWDAAMKQAGDDVPH